MPLDVARRSRNRGSTRRRSEVVLGGESANVAHLAQDPGGDKRADSGDRRELGFARLNQPSDLLL